MSRLKRILSAAAALSLTAAVFPGFSLSAGAVTEAEEVIQDGSFVYDVVDNGYAIKRCTATVVTEIPGVVNGVPIVEIEDNAFYNCVGITEIKIPTSVKKIGEGAFSFCTYLTKVTIPSSVKEIPKNAFIACSSLTELELPDTITSIGDGAFSN